MASLSLEAFAAVVVAAAVAAVGRDGGLEGSWFLVATMVLYSAWFLGSLTRAVAIAAVATAALWWTADGLVPEAGIDWQPWAMATTFTFLLGRTLQRQRHLIAELTATRRALAATAVAEERRRIARELHDLAGHTLAAVLLHVTGARHVLRRDPQEAERALLDAEEVGRASLDQIRATVAALRTSERGTDPAVGRGADLAALVDEYRRAGLVIDARIDPTAAGLEGPVGAAVARITREALANVARHAATNVVTLTVTVEDETQRSGKGAVQLVVRDRGRAATPPDPDGGHFGLVGMHERARAIGGGLEAGPTADGWLVAARLPLAETRRDGTLSPTASPPAMSPPEGAR